MRVCIVCKTAIEESRLAGIPETRLCTEHGAEIEKFGGEFKVSASQERTSKQGSLKLNYGGVSIRQVRNENALRDLQDDYEIRSFEERN